MAMLTYVNFKGENLRFGFIVICDFTYVGKKKKKCNVQMDIKNPPVKRRGHKQNNMLTEYYCPKCDHLEYDESDSNP